MLPAAKAAADLSMCTGVKACVEACVKACESAAKSTCGGESEDTEGEMCGVLAGVGVDIFVYSASVFSIYTPEQKNSSQSKCFMFSMFSMFSMFKQ